MSNFKTTKKSTGRWLIIAIFYCLALAGLFFWIAQLSPPTIATINNIRIDPLGTSLIVDGQNLTDNVSAVLTSNLQTPQTIISAISTWGSMRDIAVQGHYAWLANGSNGVICYDLQNPAKPELKAILPLKAITWKLAIGDNKLFVAAGNSGLFGIDISEPSAPKLIFTQSDHVVMDVAIKNNLAILATAKHGLVFLDTSDIYHPKQIPSTPVTGNLQAVTIYHNYVYSVGKTKEGGILQVFDISDSRHPQHISTVELSETAWACEILGNQLMLAMGNSGVYSCDISTPQNPPIPTKTIIDHYAFGLCTHANNLFVTNRSSDHIYQYTNNHGKLQQVNTLLVATSCRTVTAYNNLLLAAQRNDGFVIIDPYCAGINISVAMELPAIQYSKAKIFAYGNKICVSNAHILNLLQTNTDGSITQYDSIDFKHNIRIMTMDEKSAYVALNNKQVHILNLNQAESHRTQAVLEFSRPIYNLSPYGDYLYISLAREDLAAIDVSNISKKKPKRTTLIKISNTCSIRQGSLIYVASVPNCLKIYRVVNGNKVKLIGQLDYKTPLQTRSPMSKFIIADNYLFITNGDHGILSIDISNAAEPKLVDSLDLGGFCNNIVAQEDIACVTTNFNKIKIVNISNPKHLKRLCEIPATRSVAFMQDKLLQLTDQGIAVIPLPQQLPIITRHSNKTIFHLPTAQAGNYDLHIATKNKLLHSSDLLTVNSSGHWEMTRPFSLPITE